MVLFLDQNAILKIILMDEESARLQSIKEPSHILKTVITSSSKNYVNQETSTIKWLSRPWECTVSFYT
jgi:hypothetical protein